MTQSLNDRYSVNLVLMILFVLGIGVTLYLIYSLPAGLRLADGYQPDFLVVYIATGATFLTGLLALVWALRYKKEVVVFRDKIIDLTEAQKDAAEQAGKTTISLDSVKAALTANTLKDALQACVQSICKQLDAGQGALYQVIMENDIRQVELKSGYALSLGESTVIRFEFGEGLVGQVAATGQSLYVDDVPDGYITILSGLGSSSPNYLLIVPIKTQEQLLGVLEIASFTKTTEDQRRFVEESAHLIANKISLNA